MPVGVFGFLALGQNVRTALAATWTVVMALTLPDTIEMTRLLDEARHGGVSEVVSNLSTAVLSTALGNSFAERTQAIVALHGRLENRHRSGPAKASRNLK